MAVIIMGIFWLITAFCNVVGAQFVIGKKYRGTKEGRKLQKWFALAQGILGVGFIVLGSMNRSREAQNSFGFCAGLIVIGAIAVAVSILGRRQYNRERQTEGFIEK